MVRVRIAPDFKKDQTGGVARVVEAQRRYLPQFGIEIVDDIANADVFIGHAGEWTTRSDIPRVAYCHGVYYSDPGYAWPKWAQLRNADIARALVEADMVVTPSEWVADIIRRDLWVPVNVVPNGIDRELIDAPLGASAASYVYWNKARVDAVCEITSLTELARRSPERDFVVTVPSLRPLPNVMSIGVVPYSVAIEAMRRAGVYLATTREVFGVSVLEALACGVPILGYAWGGQREQMRLPDSGGTRPEGILVPPGDIDRLKEALETMTVPSTWRAMSEAAKERSQSYDWALIMERFAVDLHQLWSGWPGHRPAGSPLVSIVIPCYNLGQYLDGAIRSAIVAGSRAGVAMEVVVVDDASTDGETGEVCRRINAGFYGAGVRALQHTSNRYLAETLNTGIAEARGTWIINLDADNELPVDGLRNLLRAAERHPELDVVYGKMQILRADGSIDDRWGPNGVSRTYPPLTFSYAEQVNHQNQVHSSAMFKRRMWERAGGYRQYALPDSTRLNSDAEFWTRCVSLGFRFGRVTDEPTLRYRLREDSMSRTVPEWDWAEPSPRRSMVSLGAPVTEGRVLTHEPIQVSVVVDGGDPAAVVESLWPQTFDRWEVVTIDHDRRFDSAFLPPYVKRAESASEAQTMARGKWVLTIDAAVVSRLEPEALAAFVGDGTRPPGVYDENDSSLEGKVMPCGGCGGGMRVARPMAPRAARATAVADPPSVERSAAALPTGVSGKVRLIEFTGSGFRTLYMHRINPATRQRFQYVFGAVNGHSRVLVYEEDVERILVNTQYREVPLDEMTDGERAQLDAVNASFEPSPSPSPVEAGVAG